MEKERITNKAKLKLDLIKEFYNLKATIDNFCKEKNLKRRTFCRWLKQFNDSGYGGLVERSKRPKNIIETPDWAQNIIVELREKIGFGCKNISQTLDPLFKVSHSGVLKILRRKGITPEKEKKIWQTFRAPHKNHTWQMDFIGPFTTDVGEISLLVVLDDFSRYAKSKIVKGHGKTNDVIEFLDKLIEELGKPYRFLTDNGKQFRKTFDKWCERRKVKHHKSKVRHPQTLGKTEALNKSLGRYFIFDFKSIREGQEKLNAFMEWYNQIHFHSIIESTPAVAYEAQKDKIEVLNRLAREFKLEVLKNRLSNSAISRFT